MSIVSDEVKPIGGYHLPGLLAAIVERYELTKFPSLEEAKAGGAKFQNGRFAARKINIAELSIFNDALNVTTTDTSDSEIVLSDLFKWLKERFGFREPTTKPVRMFQSDLIVEFENDTSRALSLFSPLIEFVQKETESINGLKKPVQFSRLDFGGDPKILGPHTTFLIERRAGIPWESNRYFCKANMSTNAHIKALELLDKLLGKAKR